MNEDNHSKGLKMNEDNHSKGLYTRDIFPHNFTIKQTKDIDNFQP